MEIDKKVVSIITLQKVSKRWLLMKLWHRRHSHSPRLLPPLTSTASSLTTPASIPAPPPRPPVESPPRRRPHCRRRRSWPRSSSWGTSMGGEVPGVTPHYHGMKIPLIIEQFESLTKRHNQKSILPNFVILHLRFSLSSLSVWNILNKIICFETTYLNSKKRKKYVLQRKVWLQ